MGPPTVSATPPPARRVPVVGGDRPPVPHHGSVPEELKERGRVVALFGAPGSGVSTLGRVAHHATHTPTALIERGDLAEMERAVEAERLRGSDVVFLEHCPRTVEDVQWLYNKRFVAPAFGGALIRVVRNAVVEHAYDALLSRLEERIFALSMPYFVIRNDDLEQGAVDLLLRSGVTR